MKKRLKLIKIAKTRSINANLEKFCINLAIIGQWICLVIIVCNITGLNKVILLEVDKSKLFLGSY